MRTRPADRGQINPIADRADTAGAAEAPTGQRRGAGGVEDGHEAVGDGGRRVRARAGWVAGVDRSGGRVRAHVGRRQSRIASSQETWKLGGGLLLTREIVLIVVWTLTGRAGHEVHY